MSVARRRSRGYGGPSAGTTRRQQLRLAGTGYGVHLRDSLRFTHAHDHLLRTGLSQLTDPNPPRASPLRVASRAYQAAFDDFARRAHLAA